EEFAAGGDFAAGRLVLGRHAAHRIGDAGIDEFEPVVRMRPIAAAREAITGEGVVKEHACIIAGEGPAGAVCALQSWRQPDNEHTGVGRAKRGYRRVEPGGLAPPPIFPVRLEAWTERTVAAGLGGRGGGARPRRPAGPGLRLRS